MVTAAKIDIPQDKIADFCRRWKIRELALFGSVLRDDFRPDSDVDVLVTFADHARLQFSDILQMEKELAQMLGRNVDLIDRASLEKSKNWIRRRAILGSAQTVYVSR